MKKYSIPTSWGECSRQQFADIAEILFDTSENLPVPTMRLRILEALTGEKIVQNHEQRAACCQRVAAFTRFVFNISINPEISEILTPELRELLLYCLPDEVDDKLLLAELSQVAVMLQPRVDFNLNLSQNLLPVIISNRQEFTGPIFTLDKYGVLITDITVGEYLDACEYLRIFCETSNPIYLAYLTACFYRKDRSIEYNQTDAQKTVLIFTSVHPKYLKAVWLNMLSWQHFFSTHPLFGILFSKVDTNEKKRLNTGSSQLIYRLSKEGYGSVSDINCWRIDDFFALQVETIGNAVNDYRAIKKTDSEIARELKIPIETVIML